MQPNFANRKPLARRAAEPKINFKVVIAYEDRTTGHRAMSAFRCLADHLEAEFALSNKLWSFDLLRIPRIREIAARDAADADMVIVSAHGDEDLPEELKSWLQRAIQRKKPDEGALVALLDSGTGRPDLSPALEYLQQLANKTGIDFFAHGAERHPDPRFEFPETKIERRQSRAVRHTESGPNWL